MSKIAKTPEQKAAHAKKMREYYANNPEARERKKAAERAKYKADPEKYRAKRRDAYKANPDLFKQRALERYRTLAPEGLKRALQHLGGKCQRCGFDNPVALQFHHRDPATKKHEIAGTHLAKKWETLVVEVDKCDLLCANCHCLEHYAHRELT